MNNGEWTILLLGVIALGVVCALIVLALYLDAKHQGQQRAGQRLQQQVISRHPARTPLTPDPRIKWGDTATSLPPNINLRSEPSADTLTCPICDQSSADGRPTYACTNCQTLYHQVCWEYQDRKCYICSQ